MCARYCPPRPVCRQPFHIRFMYQLASAGLMTPRTQKVTSSLSGGHVTDRNRVRIDTCRIGFYCYDRCRAPSPGKPSGSSCWMPLLVSSIVVSCLSEPKSPGWPECEFHLGECRGASPLLNRLPGAMFLLGQNAPIVRRALTAIVFFLQRIPRSGSSRVSLCSIRHRRWPGSCMTLSFTTSRRFIPTLSTQECVRHISFETG